MVGGLAEARHSFNKDKDSLPFFFTAFVLMYSVF